MSNLIVTRVKKLFNTVAPIGQKIIAGQLADGRLVVAQLRESLIELTNSSRGKNGGER